MTSGIDRCDPGPVTTQISVEVSRGIPGDCHGILTSIVVRSHSSALEDSYFVSLHSAYRAVAWDCESLGCPLPPVQSFIERIEEGGTLRLVGEDGRTIEYVARPVL